jgi:predicted DNA-binding antitoxin AbrB/MazE fold protein
VRLTPRYHQGSGSIIVKEVRARFSNGKIEPLEHVDLAEGEEVFVTISERRAATFDLAEAIAATAGAWRDLVDTDALKRGIAQDRASTSPTRPGIEILVDAD